MPLRPIPANSILASHCSCCRSGVLLTHTTAVSWAALSALATTLAGDAPTASAKLAASAAIAASASGDRPEFFAAMLAAPLSATCGRCNRSFWLIHACGQSCLLSRFACLSRHFNQRFTSFFKELAISTSDLPASSKNLAACPPAAAAAVSAANYGVIQAARMAFFAAFGHTPVRRSSVSCRSSVAIVSVAACSAFRRSR